MPPWTDLEKAYIAGIIDGEGTISLGIQHNSISSRISVSNTDKGLMDYLAVMFASPVMPLKIPARDVNYRDQYAITAYYERANAIAIMVRPYLRVKAKQADLLIEFHEWREGLGYRGLHEPMTSDERAKRSEFVERMQALNKRGRRVA